MPTSDRKGRTLLNIIPQKPIYTPFLPPVVVVMSSETQHPMGSQTATKNAVSETPKVPLVKTGVARRKRGPAGRETTGPIAVSFPRQQGIPQARQSMILNGPREQMASQKLVDNFISFSIPLPSGLAAASNKPEIDLSTKSAPKIIQETTEKASAKA